ncbi:MAG: hypothetical protein LW863_17470, partial [Flammeovirgaceae bacterium]|nr:hypothetical protein [Flammeovirgaceae bacterium]
GHGQAARIAIAGHRAFRYKSSPASYRSLIGVRAFRFNRNKAIEILLLILTNENLTVPSDFHCQG